jgi:hypothetical protein
MTEEDPRRNDDEPRYERSGSRLIWIVVFAVLLVSLALNSLL